MTNKYGSADLRAKQRSWIRRVNVNSIYYFGMLLILTLIHVLYTMDYKYGVHVLAGKNDLKGHDDVAKMEAEILLITV